MFWRLGLPCANTCTPEDWKYRASSKANIQAHDGHAAPAHQLGRGLVPATTRACLLQALPDTLCSFIRRTLYDFLPEPSHNCCLTNLLHQDARAKHDKCIRLQSSPGTNHGSVVLIRSSAHRNMMKLACDLPDLFSGRLPHVESLVVTLLLDFSAGNALIMLIVCAFAHVPIHPRP